MSDDVWPDVFSQFTPHPFDIIKTHLDELHLKTKGLIEAKLIRKEADEAYESYDVVIAAVLLNYEQVIIKIVYKSLMPYPVQLLSDSDVFRNSLDFYCDSAQCADPSSLVVQLRSAFSSDYTKSILVSIMANMNRRNR